MVTPSEAKDILIQAEETANGYPDDYHRDFLLAKEPEEGTKYEAQKVDFHSNILTAVHKNLIEQLSDLVADITEEEDDEENGKDKKRTIKPYDVDNYEESPSPIQYLHKSDVENSKIAENFLTELNVSETTDFESTGGVEFQTFRMRNNFQPELVAFREFTNRQIVGSSFRVKVATFGDQEYNKMEENPIALPDMFDAIYYEGMFFVFNMSSFERMFGYFDKYQQDANEVFEYLNDSNINFQKFGRLRDTIRKSNSALRKMRKIKKREKYQNLTQDRVEKMISEWNLDLEVQTNEDGKWEIQIPDFRKVGQVLGLLDDDFVVSGIDIVADINEQERYFAKGAKESR